MGTVSRLTRFSYGAAAFPIAMLGLPLYIYLPTFYTQEIGISVTMVGILLFLARLSDVITDPLIGYYSDRMRSRYGKRKPWIVAGSFILAGGFYALIMPPTHYASLWLLLFSILTYLGWSFVSIPYLAWSAEISSDYHEKTRLSASRELLTILGALTALIVPYLFGVSKSTSLALEVLYFTFVLSLALMVPVSVLGVRENVNSRTVPLTIEKVIRLWVRIPSLARLQAAFLLNALSAALPASLFLFFVQLVLREESQTGPLLILYFISGIIGLPLWIYLSYRIGKKRSWMASMFLASAAFLWVPFLTHGDLMLFALITFVSGLSLGADMALPSSIQADIVQKHSREDRSVSGILYGFWAMLTKLALALAVGIGFVALGIAGFETDSPTPLALTTLSLLYGGFPVLFKMISFGLMKDYDETT